MNLTEKDKEIIKKCLDEGKPLPSIYKQKLFSADDTEYVESTKDYKLVYKGKARKEDIIANTPPAPLQKIRSFNSDNSFEDDWSNMLIFGDNLLALKAIYEDQQGENIYKTKNKIKLIYIDPPFATKQDFMKDREKAYQDKIIGAQFIEFIRKRLILLREILADDGSIYVHLDQKKGHYIKVILDEVFGEHNFQNNIVWKRTPFSGSSKARSTKFPVNHDSIFYYTKTKDFIFSNQYVDYSKEYKERFKYKDDIGFYRKTLLKTYSKETEQRLKKEKRFIEPEKEGAYPSYKQYLHESKGKQVEDIWSDLNLPNPMSSERLDYPTQKPEKLLERILEASSNEGDIVLDCFIGSGTTLAASEKLNRKWIGIDCGKLSIYTSQKRLFAINSILGSPEIKKESELERLKDLEEHLKSKSKSLLVISEKAKSGDLIISDTFLTNLSQFLSNNLLGANTEEISLVCPEEKFKVSKLEIQDNEDNSLAKAGEKVIQVGRVKFLISFIQPKEKPEKPKPLKAKEFTLYHAGIYDNQLILQMSWEAYRPFVAQLFGVRIDSHQIHSVQADGYIGVNSAYIWDYPNQKDLLLDEEYVRTLHLALGNNAGDKFYVIAPICSLGFMQDEIKHGNTTYVFLKVPLSVLMALINKNEPGALKQPASETDVNEVMDAIGFDFISQPVVKASYKREKPMTKDLFNAAELDYVIEISEFKSNTLAHDPEDFENFETFSMVMIDFNYNGDYFNLSQVYWSDKILDTTSQQAKIRITESEFSGDRMMVIFMDKYGNELKVIRSKSDFS